jgi:cation diffusion facilitator family transporter
VNKPCHCRLMALAVHDKSKSMSDSSIKKAIKITRVGILVNFILAIIKITAGIFGHSYALIADGIESTTDILSSGVVYIGLRISMKAPDLDHPYGHGKAEPLAAIVVGLTFLAASFIIAVQSIKHIQTPHAIPSSFTLIVLIAVVITKEILFRKVFITGIEAHSSAVKADAWHHRSDALTSLMAFIGITIALIGGKGFEVADDWAALFAAVIIFVNGINVIRGSVREIMDAAPSEEIIEKVRSIALQVPGVRGLDKSFARKMGLVYYIDLQIVVDGNLTVTEGHDLAHRVKEEILKKEPKIADVLIHVEPLHDGHTL